MHQSSRVASTQTLSVYRRVMMFGAQTGSLLKCRLTPAEPGLRAAAEHELGHRTHGRPVVHGRALDPPEGLRFGHPMLGHEHAFRALDQLARLQTFPKVGDLGLQRTDLREPRRGHLSIAGSRSRFWNGLTR